MKKTPVEKHFDRIAKSYDSYTQKRELHYKTLKRLLGRIIPQGKRVLEIGCGTGDLLTALKPKTGVGYDISGEMIKIARAKYAKSKNLKFTSVWPSGEFDYIFMSDVVEHLEKPEKTFIKISKMMGPKTIFVNTMMNPLWEPIEQIYTWLGLKMPEGPHRRASYRSIESMVGAAGMRIIKHDYALLMPVYIPLISKFLNTYVEKYIKRLAFIEFFVARKK